MTDPEFTAALKNVVQNLALLNIERLLETVLSCGEA